jgi:hypothetical protein
MVNNGIESVRAAEPLTAQLRVPPAGWVALQRATQLVDRRSGSARMSWEVFVHPVSDDRRPKHGQMLSALWVAMLHAKLPERPTAGSEAAHQS